MFYRLTSVNYGDGQTQSYGFDSMGNRASKTNVQGGSSATETYAYDNLNQLTNHSSGRSNTWDSQNRFVEYTFGGETSQLIYGGDGPRCLLFNVFLTLNR